VGGEEDEMGRREERRVGEVGEVYMDHVVCLALVLPEMSRSSSKYLYSTQCTTHTQTQSINLDLSSAAWFVTLH